MPAAARALFELLSSTPVPAAGACEQAAAVSTAAIVAGGWADTRVGALAAELAAALPEAPIVCAGGTLAPDPRERAAALEDYSDAYRSGPRPAPRGPSAETLRAALLAADGGPAAGRIRLEPASATIVEQGSNAAALLGPGATTILVVASAYQHAGLRLALNAAMPAATVVCVDTEADFASDDAWFASQGRMLPALMLAEVARLQSAHPGASVLEDLTAAAQSLDHSLDAHALSLAEAVAARGVRCVCWVRPQAIAITT